MRGERLSCAGRSRDLRLPGHTDDRSKGLGGIAARLTGVPSTSARSPVGPSA
jgi:hypothetical protein